MAPFDSLLRSFKDLLRSSLKKNISWENICHTAWAAHIPCWGAWVQGLPWTPSVVLKLQLFMYVKVRVTERAERSYTGEFTSQMVAIARAKIAARSFILLSCLCRWQEPNALWTIFCCFSQAIIRKLIWNWSSRDVNQSLYGMPAAGRSFTHYTAMLATGSAPNFYFLLIHSLEGSRH